MFSAAKHIVNKVRCSLLPENVKVMVFLEIGRSDWFTVQTCHIPSSQFTCYYFVLLSYFIGLIYTFEFTKNQSINALPAVLTNPD